MRLVCRRRSIALTAAATGGWLSRSDSYMYEDPLLLEGGQQIVAQVDLSSLLPSSGRDADTRPLLHVKKGFSVYGSVMSWLEEHYPEGRDDAPARKGALLSRLVTTVEQAVKEPWTRYAEEDAESEELDDQWLTCEPENEDGVDECRATPIEGRRRRQRLVKEHLERGKQEGMKQPTWAHYTQLPVNPGLQENLFLMMLEYESRLEVHNNICRPPMSNPMEEVWSRLGVFNAFDPERCYMQSPVFSELTPYVGPFIPGVVTDFTGIMTDYTFDCREDWEFLGNDIGGMSVRPSSSTINYRTWAPGRSYDCLLYEEWARMLTGQPHSLGKSLIFPSDAAVDQHVQRPYPQVGEEFFEWMDLTAAVRAARDQLVVVELGAGYGVWTGRAVGLNRGMNNLPYTLVLAESSPENLKKMHEHFARNSIPMSNVDVWPCFVDEKMPWAVHLHDVIQQYEKVDYLDLDIQNSEHEVMMASMSVIDERVAHMHIGTHSMLIHDDLRALLQEHGWVITRDFPFFTMNLTPFGPVLVRDGVLSAVNPRLVQ